ncbi:guanylate-binding protein 7-like [Talpa occidentalis]|uniref:guanylate-binding protein 7-like n=1 Tax=Talpa occidentalis TaxID=50954 RepID=UPI001890AF8A|nr:guanylate-binding protein 7-like [Talpa occidentalis]
MKRHLVKYCQELLEELSEDLEESISAGTFHAPGGHKLYREAMERIKRDYLCVPRKGVKANEALQDFLQSQTPIEKYILQADRALTAEQKAFAEKRARMEAAEEEQEWLKDKQEEQQQQAQAQLRDLRENIAQLREKLEKEREK